MQGTFCGGRNQTPGETIHDTNVSVVGVVRTCRNNIMVIKPRVLLWNQIERIRVRIFLVLAVLLR